MRVTVMEPSRFVRRSLRTPAWGLTQGRAIAWAIAGRAKARDIHVCAKDNVQKALREQGMAVRSGVTPHPLPVTTVFTVVGRGGRHLDGDEAVSISCTAETLAGAEGHPLRVVANVDRHMRS